MVGGEPGARGAVTRNWAARCACFHFTWSPDNPIQIPCEKGTAGCCQGRPWMSLLARPGLVRNLAACSSSPPPRWHLWLPRGLQVQERKAPAAVRMRAHEHDCRAGVGIGRRGASSGNLLFPGRARLVKQGKPTRKSLGSSTRVLCMGRLCWYQETSPFNFSLPRNLAGGR